MTADFASAAVLISFGVVLGKTSPLQLILMAIIEIVLFVANEVLGRQVFGVRLFMINTYYTILINRSLYLLYLTIFHKYLFVNLQAIDAGDTIFVHLFGAYFGLAVSRIMYHRKYEGSLKQVRIRISENYWN